ncbi:integumentary mucin C.1-like [Eupeodes corollae]|uniref:integumentary mucin C.1-like n=1 Tax=Eupeodes corollae TaxID=290404 RepID=UPI0024938FA1|nr:integumentary mucin C.1-like [Eupeodes corollae]
MKSFIFTFVVIVSCILLSQESLSLESQSTTMMTTTTTRMSTTTPATTASETPSSAPISVSTPTTIEALHPLVKAVTAPSTASPTTTATTTKAPAAGQQQCKEIGSACSVSDECCSRRCFSYRRRCAY